MNTIIQTGFEAIAHNIIIQHQTMLKGRQLVLADHVKDLKEFPKSRQSYLITEKVIRQTSVTLTPHETSLYGTMDIPVEILEEIKCHSCGGYLSRSPVYIQHDGVGVCGQCYAPMRPATRNTQYEAVVKLLKFPCKNRDLGCRETVPFAAEAEEIAHEAVCECSARCDWVGPRTALLAHCRAQHPDRVLEHPCSLTHNIARASLHNYIISAFQLLFVLHTKVCVATGKIFHAVRLVGSANHASDYSYILRIKRGVEKVTKRGQVAPEGCLAIQEDSSVAVSTNSLLDVLGGFDGTTFTVTLKRRVERCLTCEAVVTRPGGCCERCAPDKRACQNRTQGCTYTDCSHKCIKHQDYFCQQRTSCYKCKADVSRGTLAAHYGSAHQDVTYRAGSTWRAKQTGVIGKYCLFTSATGTAVCWYSLTNSRFILYVYTPVPSEQLHKFRCSVRVTDPATGYTCTYTPDLVYDQRYDWRIELKKDDFPSWNVGYDVCVNISKIS